MDDDAAEGLPHFLDPQIAALAFANAREFAILTLDEDGRITSWSPGAEAIFGYGREEAVGRVFSFLFCASDRAADADRTELETARREGKAEDSRWHVRKSGERFWGNGVNMRLEGGARGFLKILRDETPTRRAEEQRVLLLNELNHRIKNTLTTVQSIAEQTLRAGQVDPGLRENLADRLLALSAAHDVLVKENWAGADLDEIVRRTLAPHQQGARRIRIGGPVVRVSPQQAVSLSLALHELSTNAVKYGALSAEAGAVAVEWNLALDASGGRHMTLLWEESGGPPVAAPSRSGFGTRLIARHFGRESGGSATLEFAPAGLRCVIELPLSDAEKVEMLDLRSGPPGAGAGG
jgi:PAS domain S-box-containing protein